MYLATLSLCKGACMSHSVPLSSKRASNWCLGAVESQKINPGAGLWVLQEPQGPRSVLLTGQLPTSTSKLCLVGTALPFSCTLFAPMTKFQHSSERLLPSACSPPCFASFRFNWNCEGLVGPGHFNKSMVTSQQPIITPLNRHHGVKGWGCCHNVNNGSWSMCRYIWRVEQQTIKSCRTCKQFLQASVQSRFHSGVGGPQNREVQVKISQANQLTICKLRFCHYREIFQP